MAQSETDKKAAMAESAKNAAKADGYNWAELSKEERRAYRKKIGLADPARAKAISAAKDAGYSWRELTKEQRKEYLKWARQS